MIQSPAGYQGDVRIKRYLDFYQTGYGVAMLSSGTTAFSPASLFAASEQGVWYDPSDFSTMFQDAAGTTPVTAVEQPVGRILDKSGRGNHAIQATAASQPVLSARYNRFLYSEQFDNVLWVKNGGTITTNAIAAPDGTSTADLFTVDTTNGQHRVYQLSVSTSTGTNTFLIYAKPNGINYITLRVETIPNYGIMVNLLDGTTTTGRYDGTTTTTDFTNIVVSRDATTGWVSISGQFPAVGGTNAFVYLNPDTTTSTFTGNGTSGVYLWGADIRSSSEGSVIPTYQRIESSTVYDLTNFPYYLRFDGTDDSLQTANIDFTATDKTTLFAGVRKLSDAATGTIAELSSVFSSNNGTFALLASSNTAGTVGAFYRFGSRGTGAGTVSALQALASGYAAPITNIMTATGDIAGNLSTIRVNTAAGTDGTGSQGTGNYGNYPLYIGRRSGTTLPFNGRLYSLIVLGRMATAGEITDTETWVNGKTGAY